MVFEWLKNNMCDGDTKKAEKIIGRFANHTIQKLHARHISKKNVKN